MLNEKLRAKRLSHDMTIIDAAHALEMRTPEYNDIERGKVCTQEQADKICGLFGASVNELALEVGASPAAKTSRNFAQMLDENLCPTCGKEIERKQQVGRCVYAEPCLHRLYQGKLERHDNILHTKGRKLTSLCSCATWRRKIS